MIVNALLQFFWNIFPLCRQIFLSADRIQLGFLSISIAEIVIHLKRLFAASTRIISFRSSRTSAQNSPPPLLLKMIIDELPPRFHAARPDSRSPLSIWLLLKSGSLESKRHQECQTKISFKIRLKLMLLPHCSSSDHQKCHLFAFRSFATFHICWIPSFSPILGDHPVSFRSRDESSTLASTS